MRRYLTAPPARFSRSPSLPLLVWIAISGTFAIHLFVPVQSQAARDLHVSQHAIQYAITAYLFSLSLGQLCLGPLSDRIGRRPVLVAGLALYVTGSLGTALSPNMACLIVARSLQAIGGCAGLVLGRAIVRDITDAERAARMIAILGAAMSIGPGIAPLVSTELAAVFGWRGMFGMLAAVSFVLFAITSLTLPETHVARRSLDLCAYAAIWLRLLRRGDFLRICLGGAFATTSVYAFVANAPLILHDHFGFATHVVGLLYFMVVCCLTGGSLLASVLATRVALHAVTVTTSLVMAAASLLLLGLSLAGALGAGGYLALVMVLVASLGICGPFALTAAVNADLAAIGAASGLYGCLQMATGAGIVISLGIIPAAPSLATSIVFLTCSMIAAACFAYPDSKSARAARSATVS